MTPLEFIKKWKPVALTERATAQSHFNDLCALLGHDDPIKADPTGDWFTFEKGVPKTGGGDGFADVWKKGFFAWEYKKKKRNLDEAFAQLVRYAAALENPPLQVTCDTDRILVRTAWTNAVPKTYELSLDDLANPQKLSILRSVFYEPEKLRPTETRAGLTKEAADKFSTISSRLQGRGTPEQVAHFVNQLVFCFFAHSVKLLPNGFFPRLLKRASENPENSKRYFDSLFAAMETGGDFDLTKIAHFNGGLFDGRRALPLDSSDVGLLIAAASLDWSLIDPSIFGTLFERFLDPEKRGQIGAHYTDPDKIMMLVNPVIVRPLREEWTEAKKSIEKLVDEAHLKSGQSYRNAIARAEEARSGFMERLRKITILDPACGSGNFLYLALQAIKDIELRANLECEVLGLSPRAPAIGPEIVKGIEINPLAAELARTTIWIGDIQWSLRNGIYARPEPILRKLDSIECRDAILARNPDGSPIEAQWPETEFIVGNPPFLGGKLMRAGLGNETVDHLFLVYDERVPPEADLVVYWFEKARAALNAKHVRRVGLVATNSIRGGANRRILDHIVAEDRIFDAWSDEAWVVEGAAVRVSLICFSKDHDASWLNGQPVTGINADLSAGTLDLTKAKRLADNIGLSFQGVKFGGPFEIIPEAARSLLIAPLNPNGRPNSDVIRRWCNGMDITRRQEDRWCIDFDPSFDEREATLFELPYQLLKDAFAKENERRKIAGKRALRAREERTAEGWWIHQRPREDMRNRLKGLSRFIATPEVAKHRVFLFFDPVYLTSGSVYAITRDDDCAFGILHSRFHQSWSLRLGTTLEDRPRYTPSTTFETFPFPEGLTPNIPAKDYATDPRAVAIAAAARRLDHLRSNWLNPPDLVRIEPEVMPGYPDRILPKDAQAAVTLRERTLTNLYNSCPQWLTDAHRDLDAAVATAYGWSVDIPEEQALTKLLELNLARVAVGKSTLSASDFDAVDEDNEVVG